MFDATPFLTSGIYTCDSQGIYINVLRYHPFLLRKTLKIYGNGREQPSIKNILKLHFFVRVMLFPNFLKVTAGKKIVIHSLYQMQKLLFLSKSLFLKVSIALQIIL